MMVIIMEKNSIIEGIRLSRFGLYTRIMKTYIEYIVQEYTRGGGAKTGCTG